MKRFLFLIICLFMLAAPLWAQKITGVVTDAETGDSIAYASIVYKGHHVSAVSDYYGRYSIDRHEGWNITVSAVGYATRIIPVNAKTKHVLNIALKPDDQTIGEVVVSQKRDKYSRKNNPAVELMKKVIANKKVTDLSRKDYYQYMKYQKLTLALNVMFGLALAFWEWVQLTWKLCILL